MALQNLQISNQGELSEFSFSDFSDFCSLYHSTKESHAPTQESNTMVFNPGRKRKMSNQDYDEHMPNKQRTPQQQHAQQFFCDICKVQLNSLTQAEQHKRGKSHRLKEQIKQSQPGAMNPMKDSNEEHSESLELSFSFTCTSDIPPKLKALPLDRVGLDCLICGRKFNSTTQVAQHFNGQSHQRKLQALSQTGDEGNIKELTVPSSLGTVVSQEQPEKALLQDTNTSETVSSVNKETNELHCEFCRLTLNSKSQMDMHLKGKMHWKSVSRVVLLPTVGNPPMKFYCDECIMSFNSQIQMEQHLSSPKHINRVQRQQACEQSRGRTIRGRGRGQGRGRGGTSLRAWQKNRGRGAVFSKFPPISSSFVKASSNLTCMVNPNDSLSGQQTQSANRDVNSNVQRPSLCKL